jgi:hypothetical protein
MFFSSLLSHKCEEREQKLHKNSKLLWGENHAIVVSGGGIVSYFVVLSTY